MELRRSLQHSRILVGEEFGGIHKEFTVELEYPQGKENDE
jgi:hypothetical protein